MKSTKFKIPLKIKKELKHYEETGIPRCIHCKTDFKQLDGYTWRPDCKCFNNKGLRLSIG